MEKMTTKQKMGFDLLTIEKILIDKGYFVIGQHDYYDYFTVENKDGLQVYCQVSDYCMGYDLSINYKPSRGNGSGISYKKNLWLEDLVTEIENAFKDGFSLHHVRLNGKPKSIINKMVETMKRRKILGFRELNILKNLETIVQNKDVPSKYYIFEFYDKNGNGFEMGRTINDGYDCYSITN